MFSGGENWCRAGGTPSSRTSVVLLRIWSSPAAVPGKAAGSSELNCGHFPRLDPFSKDVPHLFAVGILPVRLSQLGLHSQLVRAQLASFKHAGCSLSPLDKVSGGEKHFGLLCT